jgi:hypothetical protein
MTERPIIFNDGAAYERMMVPSRNCAPARGGGPIASGSMLLTVSYIL